MKVTFVYSEHDVLHLPPRKYLERQPPGFPTTRLLGRPHCLSPRPQFQTNSRFQYKSSSYLSKHLPPIVQPDTTDMAYHMPASHAIVITIILVAAFVIFFSWCLYNSCGRAVDAEFVVLEEQRRAQAEGAQA